MRGLVISSSCAARAVIPNLQLRHSSVHSFSPPLPPPLLLINKSSFKNKNKNKTFSLPPLNPNLPSLKPIHFSSSQLHSMAEEASSTQSPPKPFSVLFVCLGNICRSPAAEAVFRHLVHKKGVESAFLIDSCGTIGYHKGDPADSRMRAASKRRGIEVTSISRPLRPTDFGDFDLIVPMDMQNKDDILSAYERWSFKETLPPDAQNKVKLMCSYCTKHKETEVPDPYYGGPQGFEKVLDLLEDACEALLDSILAENSITVV